VGRAHLVLNDLGGEARLTCTASHLQSFASAVLINTGILVDYCCHLIGKLHQIPALGK
jgi:hypothetical protein